MAFCLQYNFLYSVKSECPSCYFPFSKSGWWFILPSSAKEEEETFLSFEHTNPILKNVGNQTVDGSHWLPFCLHIMEVNGDQKLFGYQHSSKYHLLCLTEERNSYRFGATWGWVNDDRIFIFGWVLYFSIYTMVCLNTGFWLAGRYAVKQFNAQVVLGQFNHCSILMRCFNWCTLTNTHTHTNTERERERSQIALHTHINLSTLPHDFY